MLAPHAPVDAAAIRARADGFASRSIKADAKRAAIDLAIRCVDLTTLEGRDTPERVRSLCGRARNPGSGAPSVAAVCVYPTLVATATAALRGTDVLVASVAGAFPSSLSSLAVKSADVEAALAAGADEIDMVIDRGAFLAGDEATVIAEIRTLKAMCGPIHLKVILEIGELGSLQAVRRASDIALAAGADTIKTSTGKIGENATLAGTLVMAEAIRDFARATGERRGLKVAGGIRTTKTAFAYLVLVDEILGDAWLDPHAFRIGASSLLDDLVMQRERAATGRYASTESLPKD